MSSGKHVKKRTVDKGRLLRAVLLTVAALCLAYSLYRLIDLKSSYSTAEKTYSTIANSVISITQEPEAPREQDTGKNGVPSSKTEAGNEGKQQSASAGSDSRGGSTRRRRIEVSDLLEDGTKEKRKYLIDLDFDALLAVNEHTIAWLYNPGTEISYPVMQSMDNIDFLRHLPDGTYSEGGSLFVDYRQDGFSDRYTIIYGHYRKYGTMFTSLLNYRDQAYYDTHSTMFLFTPEDTYELQIISVVSVADDNRYCYTMSVSETELDEFLRFAADNTVVDTGFVPGEQVVERLVALSTCSYEFENSRLVVLCSMVPVAQDDGT